MQSLLLEITDRSYLILPFDLARAHFPEDACVALFRPPELWLMPLHKSQTGGLLLKQRNREGDRSVLLFEVLPEDIRAGTYAAFWDERQGALRVAVKTNG